jgi:hypoxanthine-guanine phosphoribosyltransferase
MLQDLERVLFDEATILKRLDEIAAQISEGYRDRALTVIAVLNGSLISWPISSGGFRCR